MWEGLMAGLALVGKPFVLAGIIGGVVIGMIIGALPGLGASVGMSLLLPLLFWFPPEVGVPLLVALWAADGYGGAISSILLKIPGGAGAVVTCMDGYPMTKQGRALEAMGLSMGASVFAGIVGALAYVLFAPPLARVVIAFNAPDYFLLCILGLLVVASASRGKFLRGLISTGLGFLLGMIGVDLMTGYPRFSFGSAYLLGGIEIEVLILGIFAIGSMLPSLIGEAATVAEAKLAGSIYVGIRNTFRYPATLIKSTLIGLGFGALPGAGVVAASAVAYQNAVSSSKHPETFGQGDPEGVIAPEAANNSVQGGALIPTLTLGIPGSVSAVVFLGALIMYGIRVGPRIFQAETAPLAYSIFWAMIVGTFGYLVFGVIFAKPFAMIAYVPIPILVPLVLAMACLGVYASRLNFTDVLVAVVFGLLGYCMDVADYPLVPFMLAFVLGPDIEQHFFRSLMLSNGSYKIFVQSPISIALIVLTVFALIMAVRPYLRRKPVSASKENASPL